jgi:hypothetical protein
LGDSACVWLGDDFSSADASASLWFPRGQPAFFDGFGQLTPYDYNQAGGILWKTPTPLDAYDLRFEVSSLDVPPGTDGGEGPISTGIAFVALDTPQASVACRSGDSLCELGNAPGYAVVLATCSRGCRSGASPFPIIVTETAPYPDGGFVDADIALAPNVITPMGSVPAAADGTPPETSWHTVEIRVSSGSATVLLDGVTILSSAPIQGDASFRGYWGFGAGTGNRTRNLVRKVAMSIGAGCTAALDGG